MDLFLEPTQYETTKTAATETPLPEDPISWPTEILQELFKQVPYIADFTPNIVMDRVDAERGYGLGHAEIQNKSELQSGTTDEQQAAVGVRMVRIPLIIKESKLQPLDVVVTEDSKMLPLTESRLRQALFRPQAFDVTSRTPGDQSMVGQLYPPYRQNNGFGGGGTTMNVGMGKEGSALEQFLTSKTAGEKCPKCGKEKCACMSKMSDFGGTGSDMSAGISASSMGKSAAPQFLLHAIYRGDAEEAKKGHAALIKQKGTASDIKAHEEYIKAHSKKDLEKEGSTAWRRALDSGKVTAKDFKKKLDVPSFPKGLKREIENYEAPGSLSSGRADYFVQKNSDRAAKGISFGKTSSILAAILPTINASDYTKFAHILSQPGLQDAFLDNRAATGESLQTLLSYEPVSAEKRAMVLPSVLRPDVLQLIKEDSGYTVKTANHNVWHIFSKSIDRGEAVSRFGEKIVLAADMSGAVTAVEGASAVADHAAPVPPELIKEFGLYKVQDEDDGKELVGFVIPNLIDIDGMELPMALFTNGSEVAVQGEISGVRAGDGAGLPTGGVEDTGCFYSLDEQGRIQATIPYSIKGHATQGEDHRMMAETFDGRSVQIAQQPNIQHIEFVDGTVLVPESWKWLPLGEAESVSLVGAAEDMGKQAAALESVLSVVLRAGGADSFSLEGFALEKIARDQREFLDRDETMFLLGGLGVEPTYAIGKIAQAYANNAPVNVRISRHIKTAGQAHQESMKLAQARFANFPNLRQDLVKEAAFIPDPGAVDSVLSLGFINPENIHVFLSALPKLEDSQGRLCELLIAARLGMRELPVSALEKSIRAVEEVIEGLKTLAFQEN